MGEAYGFQHAPGGPQWANKSVLSFHDSVAPKLSPLPHYYELRYGEAKRLGTGAVVTESGIDNSDLMDSYGWSNMIWDYKWYYFQNNPVVCPVLFFSFLL